jgi:hypothetical protein
MALDLALLREIPVGVAEETVFYRAVHIPERGEPDPLFAGQHHGRWPTAWTLYTGSSEPVAWAEYCRNHPDDVALSDVTGGVGLTSASLRQFAKLEVSKALPRRSLYELRFAFARMANLTSPWAEDLLARAGFDLGSFYADGPEGYGDCPELARLVGDLGWEAIRVPSAAWQRPDGFCVPVFEAGRNKLVSQTRAVESASPTVALAAATAYAEGKRPAWLGGA